MSPDKRGGVSVLLHHLLDQLLELSAGLGVPSCMRELVSNLETVVNTDNCLQSSTRS